MKNNPRLIKFRKLLKRGIELDLIVKKCGVLTRKKTTLYFRDNALDLKISKFNYYLYLNNLNTSIYAHESNKPNEFKLIYKIYGNEIQFQVYIFDVINYKTKIMLIKLLNELIESYLPDNTAYLKENKYVIYNPLLAL